MDKQYVAYTYNEILFRLKKDKNANTCYNMGTLLSEISQTQKDKYCMIPLIWDTYSSQIDRK